jgi:hypothetical protein
MPPRRSARVAAAAERGSGLFASLPLALTQHVLSLLPADARARAACVCRLWRATLEDGQAWAALDLTAAAGLARPATVGALRAAAARARGALRTLDVSSCAGITHAALLAVVAANAGALFRLRAHGSAWARDVASVRALAAAAPRLHTLDADVEAADVAEAAEALRREGRLAPLRLRALAVDCGGASAEALTSLAADVASHGSLTRLSLTHARLHAPGVLDALVGALLARRVPSLALWECTFPDAPAASLARLCAGGALQELSLISSLVAADDAPLLRGDDAAGAAALAAALAGNASLGSVTLMGVGLWRDAGAAAALLGALTGHPSLRTLKLPLNAIGGDAARRGAAGAALGALVAANAAALTELDVSYCGLGDEGLRPLFEALPANSHLRGLDVRRSVVSARFAARVLAPAVCANRSLAALQAEHFLDSSAGARAAEADVQRRRGDATAQAARG